MNKINKFLTIIFAINLVVDLEDGMTKVFNIYEEAKKEAEDCQNGIVINLGN